MQKGQVIENVYVENMAAEGKCISHIDGKVIFLQGGAPGDTVDVRLTRIKSGFLEGTVVAIKQYSPNREQPFCEHFGTCGGCSWQHIRYADQLNYKQQQVVDNLERLGGLTLPGIQPILGSTNTKYYRNKLDFTFSAQGWLTKEELHARKSALGRDGNEKILYTPEDVALGYHIPRKYDLVFDVKQCYLQADPSNAIRLATRDEAIKGGIPFFDLRKQIGFLRTITIRTATRGDDHFAGDIR
jgi:23S rRNA (uracil1939-C5)-methyltransferase